MIAYDKLTKREFGRAPWVHGTSFDDPDALWHEFFIQGAPRNYSERSTPEIEAAFRKQTVELDAAKRKQLVTDMERTSLPALGKSVLFWARGRTGTSKSVNDYLPHISPYNNNRFENIWFSAQRGRTRGQARRNLGAIEARSFARLLFS